MNPANPTYPTIRTAGYNGFLVSFAATLSEPANRAAIAFRAALERENWAAVEETSTSLVSTYLRFDPLGCDHPEMSRKLQSLLETTDWFAAPLPAGRRLWHVPTVYGTDLAPQLEDAAALAGITPQQAIASISKSRLRVQTIGFAPGQPYLGELPAEWDIPRQTTLTPQVPEGALTVAIRQVVLFSVPSPTGWRHVGQTGLRLFQPDTDDPFTLRQGDEVIFDAVTRAEFENMQANAPHAGATCEPLP